MLRHLRQSLRVQARLSGSRGSVAMEFALIAPVLFMLMTGTIEGSLIMFTQHVMENATYNASRTGKTGYVEEGLTREETIKKVIEDRAGSFIDMDDVTITSKSYSDFSQIGQPEPFIDANQNGVRDDGENFTDLNGDGVFNSDRGSDNQGNAQNVVVYTVTYPWQIFTPVMGHLIGDEGVMMLSSRIVVRNEPY